MSKRPLEEPPLPEPKRIIPEGYIHLSKLAFYRKHKPTDEISEPLKSEWERDWAQAEFARSHGMLFVNLNSKFTDRYYQPERVFIEDIRRDGMLPIRVKLIVESQIRDWFGENKGTLSGWRLYGESKGTWRKRLDLVHSTISFPYSSGIETTADWVFDWVPGYAHVRVQGVEHEINQHVTWDLQPRWLDK